MHLPAEIIENYSAAGKIKSEQPLWRMLILSVVAGMVIAFGGAASNTAVHAIGNAGLARMVCGLLFPFGLGIIMLTGLELFTGNCMLVITVADGRTGLRSMLRNWAGVYIGNFIGSLMVAASCAFFGQLDHSGGNLAVFTIRIAAAKCSLDLQTGLIFGVLCNILVCLGVICSLSARDTFGKIAGAYIPVALFVLCGFEHSVANMFYIPAGLFAMQVDRYAQLAQSAGIDVSTLNWGNFLLRNLLPVTIGNILGGMGVAAAMRLCHKRIGLLKTDAHPIERDEQAKEEFVIR